MVAPEPTTAAATGGRRRRHRRRRRSRRVHRRHLPGPCRSRRPAAGEVDVPPARRSAATGSPPAGSSSSSTSASTAREQNGWLHNRGLRVVGGGVSLELEWPTLAELPRLRRRPAAPGLRRAAGPPRREVRRAAARGHHGHRGPRRRAHAAGSPASPAPRRAGQGQAPGRLPRPAHPGLRRRVRPARAEHRAWPSATTGRWASPSAATTTARARTTTTSRATSSCGTAPTRRTPSCCPATAGSSAWATARRNVGLGILSTSRAYGSTDYRALLRSWLDGTPEEWGYREENAVGAVGGAALPMGFNRTPHYRPGPAAGRRRGRDGQPVQRRGHRLRDGVGGDRVALRGPVAGPPGRRRPRRRWRATRGRCARPSAATTASATSSPGSSATRRSWAWPPGTACPARR